MVFLFKYRIQYAENGTAWCNEVSTAGTVIENDTKNGAK